MTKPVRTLIITAILATQATVAWATNYLVTSTADSGPCLLYTSRCV